ncbi:transcription initiation factor TFIID subunit A [Colletotrichum salicis]|uniref:Transcription initiation factor TFIID subunit A n=1 Tax=Colletotrichum salicis TaxID=1209931 RepID=A0A135UZS5_9PEZI|nr:transcription initiation factor TFIID subunit A [Colletotrichum salicis]
MNNQGQPGQAAAGQTVPSARQPPMYRPEMMRNLPILNDEEKQKYERGLRQLWNHYETHPEESAQHQDAKKKIQDFTKMLLNKLQQRRMQVQQQQQAQQQAAQQQQQGGQQAQQQQSQPVQPAAPAQQAQPAQQQAPAAAASQANVGGVTMKTEPKIENTATTTAEPAHAPTPAPAPAAAAPTPTAPQQAPQATQFPDHILAHIRQMTFNPPQGILDKGQEAAARWSNDFKAKYLRALMQMDQQGIQIRRIDAHVKNQQEKGALGTDEAKQLQIRRDHAQKMHTEAQTFVQNFRKSQEGINKARAAVAAAAAAGQTAASASAAAAQQRPPSQQQQQNSPAVAASQPPSTQPGGTPTQRVATPQSAAPAGPGQALSHSAAVSRANQRNVQTSVPVQQATGTPGSAGAHAQGVMGSGAVPQQQHAHPTQPTQTLQSKLPIPKQLPEKATSVPQPVAMAGGAGAGRPTYTGGGGIAGGVMGQPAISKIPAYVHEAEGDHVLSKKKLDELVRQVCGGNAEGQEINMLTPEVEESVLAMADSFVDNVLETACRNAKERGSKVLEIRDIQLVLERTYNIRVPGYSSDELRTVRKIQPSTAWITKMSAIQAAKVTSGKGEYTAKRSTAKSVRFNQEHGGERATSPPKTILSRARSRKTASPAKKASTSGNASTQATGPPLRQFSVDGDNQQADLSMATHMEVNFLPAKK